MYKDKDKQRAANKERQRRYKAKQKGVTRVGVTCGALPLAEPQGVTLEPNLELCWTCQEPLPPLEKPRKGPGMCLGCVTEKYRVVKPGVPVGSTA